MAAAMFPPDIPDEVDIATVASRTWPLTAAALHDDEWNTTSPAKFALRVLACRDRVPALATACELTAIDIMPLPERHHTLYDLDWDGPDEDYFQWLRGCTFEPGSLADADGDLSVWRKLSYFLGPRFTLPHLSKGAPY